MTSEVDHPRAYESILPAAVLDQVPQLRDPGRQVTELPGGLTNHNFKVTTGAGAYVVRVSSPDAGLLAIDRQHEFHNTTAAATAEAGPPVVAFLPAAGVLVVAFIEGSTFTDASFAVPGNVVRVAAACRRLHRGPRFANDFDMFALQQRYLSLVRDRGYRLPPGYLVHLDAMHAVHQALQAAPVTTVPCNNDLLAGNIVDDGDRVWLIDYEYAGNNDACFELGNLWSECHLEDEQLAELVTAYDGATSAARVARCRLWALMSQYGWTLWASIQQATSEIDFDFWGWGMEKYERAQHTFRARNFGKLLAAAASPAARPEGAL